jgi:hypothetical protein
VYNKVVVKFIAVTACVYSFTRKLIMDAKSSVTMTYKTEQRKLRNGMLPLSFERLLFEPLPQIAAVVVVVVVVVVNMNSMKRVLLEKTEFSLSGIRSFI